MADKGTSGQADKADAEVKTAVGDVDSGEDSTVDPYPNYDFMTLEDLRALAADRGVEMNRDVEKAHLITELRAADSGTPSAVTKHGAR